MPRPQSREIIIKGITGSPGICIGKAYIVDREGVNIIKKYYISSSSIKQEINRFKNAVKKAKDEHALIIKSLNNDLSSHINILETHMVLFKDKMLYKKAIDTIYNDKVNAEWALKKVVDQAKSMFQKIDDTYLKSRVIDIVQVGEQIMRYLVGAQDVKISDINKRVILVAHDLSPADTSQINLERIKGFVTDLGGKDSHTGIIAKSLNIPSVLGLEKATTFVNNDDILIVDGTSGVIIINPEENTLFKYEGKRTNYDKYIASLAKNNYLPAVTLDGEKITLMANIELIEEVVSVIDNVADGVGLFRTEFIYLDLKRFPTEEELFNKYKELIDRLTPKPVTIRTLDINGDKVVFYLNSKEETNPALGLRGVRFCLKRTEIFITQIKSYIKGCILWQYKTFNSNDIMY